MKKTIFSILFLCLTGIVFNSCDGFDGDQETPAYLKINKIEIDPSSSSDPGRLTSDIRSVWITAVNAKKNKEESIGVFELPCTVPILLEGDVQINLYPVIWQDYNIKTQTVYPFFNKITDTVRLTKNTVTELDSVVYTNYDSSTDIAWYENFGNVSIDFTDTSGYIESKDMGFSEVGYINFNSVDSLYLFSSEIFNPTSSQAAQSGIYLELDYWTKDVLYIGVQGVYRYDSDQTTTRFQEIMVSPIKDDSDPSDRTSWRKAYMALYPTCYYYLNMDYSFRVVLYAKKRSSNKDHSGVYLDNIKLVYSK